jgi:hypothetical protein
MRVVSGNLFDRKRALRAIPGDRPVQDAQEGACSDSWILAFEAPGGNALREDITPLCLELFSVVQVVCFLFYFV